MQAFYYREVTRPHQAASVAGFLFSFPACRASSRNGLSGAASLICGGSCVTLPRWAPEEAKYHPARPSRRWSCRPCASHITHLGSGALAPFHRLPVPLPAPERARRDDRTAALLCCSAFDRRRPWLVFLSWTGRRTPCMLCEQPLPAWLSETGSPRQGMMCICTPYRTPCGGDGACAIVIGNFTRATAAVRSWWPAPCNAHAMHRSWTFRSVRRGTCGRTPYGVHTQLLGTPTVPTAP